MSYLRAFRFDKIKIDRPLAVLTLRAGTRDGVAVRCSAGGAAALGPAGCWNLSAATRSAAAPNRYLDTVFFGVIPSGFQRGALEGVQADGSLFAQLAKHELFTPTRTYPTMTVKELADAC